MGRQRPGGLQQLNPLRMRSERGIAWRLRDSLSLRCFLGLALDHDPPDHSTLSRTRRRLTLPMHQQRPRRAHHQNERRSHPPGYKDEHAVDLDTGAIIAVTVQEADTGDTKSLPVTLQQAEANLVAIREESARLARPESGVEEVVTDKGYHSDEILLHCEERKIRTYISEPNRKRKWKGQTGTAIKCGAEPGAAHARPVRSGHAEAVRGAARAELSTAAGLLGTLWFLLSTLWGQLSQHWTPPRTVQPPWQLGCAA